MIVQTRPATRIHVPIHVARVDNNGCPGTLTGKLKEKVAAKSESYGLRWTTTDMALAETEGFEPSIPIARYNDLANRRLQPLGHVSMQAKQALSIALRT